MYGDTISYRRHGQPRSDSNNTYRQGVDELRRYYICGDCQEGFPTQVELTEHFVKSRRHHYCLKCNIHFLNDEGLEEHLKTSNMHHYCTSCERDFGSASNLNSHLHSALHLLKIFRCPAGCGKAFISPSAFVLHLESGYCSSGFNRRLVNDFIRKLDINNIITDPKRMITLTGKPNLDDNEIIYVADFRSWNGYHYECHLCNGKYGSLAALSQHLASPRHQQKKFRCLGSGCAYRCSTLSALLQHIESGKCGAQQSISARKDIGKLLWPFRILSITT